tara:strand:+ start:565 stop:1872 length:1308 start_codon:yes stop_codon:yes gene_type:complete
MKKYKSYQLRSILFLFFVSLFFYTPFNYSGLTPICLIISIILLLTLFLKNIKIPKINLVDISLFSFLIYLPINAVINIDQIFLNYNHLFAYYAVIILYYFTLRLWIFNYLGNNFNLTLNYLSIGFILICLSGIIDYVLMQNWIFLHDYLPMPESNTLISGIINNKDNYEKTIWVRAKGFYTEPTLLAYAIASLGPIVLQYNLKYKSGYRFILILLLFVVALILSRSVTAFVAIGCALIATIILSVDVIKIKNKVKQTSFLLIITVLLLSAILTLFLAIYDGTGDGYLTNIYNYLTHYYDVLSRKLFGLFNADVNSTTSNSTIERSERWLFTISYIFNSDKMLFGFGPGFESAGGLEGGSTLNWWLNVILDYGILGFLIILFSILGTFYNIFTNHSEMKISLFMSLIISIIYLITHTGFYFPNLWIILVLSGIKFK